MLLCMLSAAMCLGLAACSGDGETADGTADTDHVTAETAAETDAKKPYNAGTFPKDATEVRYSDFGAVGDGVTDDHQKNQQALDVIVKIDSFLARRCGKMFDFLVQAAYPLLFAEINLVFFKSRTLSFCNETVLYCIKVHIFLLICRRP